MAIHDHKRIATVNELALDNAVWNSIVGPHRALAETAGKAGRFDRDVAPFSGVSDINAPDAWEDLARLVGPGKPAILFAPKIPEPPGWSREHTIPTLQMVASTVDARPTDDQFVELGSDDVPDMLRLIDDTRPGPFGPRTIELGGYIGHRIDGRLVAMAGERLRCEGFTEVSAVCTTPDYRGQGLGAALVLAVVDRIRARGDEAFLHVAADNTNAIRLYFALGFTVRREAEAVIVRVPGGD